MNGPGDQPSPCPDAETLTRVFGQEGEADPAVRAHVRGCAPCQAEWQSADWVRELGQMLPHEQPDPERRQRVRTALLERLPAHRPLRGPFALLLVGGLAAALVLVLMRSPAPSPVRPLSPALAPSRIEASAGARFFLKSGPPHEVVRLHEGTLHVTVEPLAAGARSFRVIAGDGEVQVRGTIFETTVLADHLTAVRVERGQVIVRPSEGPPVELGAGADWQATPAAAAPPTNSPAAVGRGRPALERRTPAERAFDLGLRALGAGDAAAAATAFSRADALAVDTPIAEEASYWWAVSQLRSGDRSGARGTLEKFLLRFPASPRAGEASVMLGWLLLEGGDPAAARTRFRAALTDPSPRVKRAATEALQSAGN